MNERQKHIFIFFIFYQFFRKLHTKQAERFFFHTFLLNKSHLSWHLFNLSCPQLASPGTAVACTALTFSPICFNELSTDSISFTYSFKRQKKCLHMNRNKMNFECQKSVNSMTTAPMVLTVLWPCTGSALLADSLCHPALWYHETLSPEPRPTNVPLPPNAPAIPNVFKYPSYNVHFFKLCVFVCSLLQLPDYPSCFPGCTSASPAHRARWRTACSTSPVLQNRRLVVFAQSPDTGSGRRRHTSL